MTKEMKQKLESHLKMNVNLGQLYLQLSSMAQFRHMNNLACFIKNLSDDKITVHKDLIWQYLNDEGEEVNVVGATCESEAIIKPKVMALKTVDDIFELVNFIEGTVVKDKVQEIAALSLKTEDYETLAFWKWFVDDRIKDYGREWTQVYDAYKLEKAYGNDHLDYLKVDKMIGQINHKLGIKCQDCDCK